MTEDIKDFEELHSPIREELEDNVQYIIIDPSSLSDDGSGSQKKQNHWEYWETKTLIDIMKEQNDLVMSGKKNVKATENFFFLEQEMRKHGVERWDSSQIQQKWRNLRKDWVNARLGNYKNGVSKTMSEFQDDLDELFGTPPFNYSLSGIDNTSGDDILGYEVETLEPTDDIDTVLKIEDKMSQGFVRNSPLPCVEQRTTLGNTVDVKPSTSSDDCQEVDSAHEAKRIQLKSKDVSAQGKKDTFIWPHAGVLLLLEQYKKLEHEFLLGTRRHNKIWDDIAKAICSANSDWKVTGSQCQQKMGGLKRTYLSIKEHRHTHAGGDRISWPYFPIVDQIVRNRASVRSSKDQIPKKRKHSSSSSSSNEGDNPGMSYDERPGVGTILEQYIQDIKKHRELSRLRQERRAVEKARKKEEMERQKMEQRLKMHQEKMAIQKAALDILKQILLKNK